MADGPTYISVNAPNVITITLIAFFGFAVVGAIVSLMRQYSAPVSD